MMRQTELANATRSVAGSTGATKPGLASAAEAACRGQDGAKQSAIAQVEVRVIGGAMLGSLAISSLAACALVEIS